MFDVHRCIMNHDQVFHNRPMQLGNDVNNEAHGVCLIAPLPTFHDDDNVRAAANPIIMRPTHSFEFNNWLYHEITLYSTNDYFASFLEFIVENNQVFISEIL